MARHTGGERTVPLTSLGAGGPRVSRIGLGLAALGRPAYITSGRAEDLPERTVAAMRAQTFSVLDAAYEAGIRYVDVARSYGRAEEFLSGWLAGPGHGELVVGSKWGYRYTGDWRLEADQHEVKEHSLVMFTGQLGETRSLLGGRLALYQVHSLTLESPLFGDPALLAALGALRDSGVIVGLTTSGPHQADTLRRALDVSVGGQPLFAAAQVTWNLLEPSVGTAAAEAAAAGWAVLVKEALANGRLAPAEGADGADGAERADGATGDAGADGDAPGPPARLSALAAERGTGEDAIALAAALGNPWATVVLSGAVTAAQLHANLGALTVGDVPPLDLAEPPAAYWAARAARAWR
jgi:aryl-alcohol dehydrogenase-like predicted oxidoreductase